MNPTKQTLEAFAKLTEGKQHELWTKAAKRVKLVEIVPISDPRLEPLKPILKRIKAKEHECYLNALACVLQQKDIEYVEGYIEVNGVPIDHAWNCWNGLYFDLTEEKLGTPTSFPHRQVMKLPGTEAFVFAMSSSRTGPYLFEWLDRN